MVTKNIHVHYDMQGNLVKNLGAPVDPNDASTKSYTDTAVVSALAAYQWKTSVRVATTVAGVLATDFENGDTIDGEVLVTGNRILIKDQAAPEENGIYVVQASGPPVRALDADNAVDLLQAALFVQEGTANAEDAFVNSTDAPIVLGTTGLVFIPFPGTGGGGSALTIQEIDGTPLDNAVTIIRVTNGKLTDNGAGDVTLDLSGGGGGGDSVLTDVHASRPAASSDGNLFLPSDGFSIERDTGSVYTPWGPIFPLTPPDNSLFAWINQTSASVTATVTAGKNGIYFHTPKTSGGSNNVRARTKAAPSTPYVITVGFLFIGDLFAGGASGLANEAGLVFRQSSDGKLVAFIMGQVANLALRKWTSPTVFSAEYFNSASSGWIWNQGSIIWMRIADDGTNRICSISADGQNFIPVHTVGRTDFLTADEVGVMVRADSTSAGSLGGAGMTLLSWKES